MATNRRVITYDSIQMSANGRIEGEFNIRTNAQFLKDRLDMWNSLVEADAKAKAALPREKITITLPDGTKKEGVAHETTPLQIAEGISNSLAKNVCVAKVVFEKALETNVVDADDDESDAEEEECCGGHGKKEAVLWDLTRALPGSCELQLLKFSDKEGRDTFNHSSAHILGCALEQVYGCHLTIGPALQTGFYYDQYVGNYRVKEDDYKKIEDEAQKTIKSALPFERLELTKKQALELFKHNPFKVQLITNKVPDDAMTSCYRCGELIDLCRGPHLPSTARVGSFAVQKHSSAYWLGKQENDSLQRIYGVSFPTEKEMKQYKKFLEEAAKRDHRKIGTDQGLFYFHPKFSAGSCFWTPMGARLYNRLCELMRQEYQLRGFSEVVTPNIASQELFLTSGHAQKYADNMYGFDVEGEKWYLKPMNCPTHAALFASTSRTYRDLPLRMADFGVLHRNELSGTLSGLQRVRRFQQDDAHIFCTPEQVEAEVLGALNFVKWVYNIFNFEVEFALSTRPKKYLGERALWDKAEASLKNALEQAGIKYQMNLGDGAFYGPKIDIRLFDALKRPHQCGTIQLDFQLPIRFNLQYHAGDDSIIDNTPDDKLMKDVHKHKDGSEFVWKEQRCKAGHRRPVMVHRAILGSVERFASILIESTAGKWPFWLNPRQIGLVPVSDKFNNYAKYVEAQLTKFGYYVETDTSGATMQKKVALMQTQQISFILVVGEQEEARLSVNVRERDNKKPLGEFSLGDFVAMLKKDRAMPASQPLGVFDAYQGRMPAAVAGAENAAAPAGAAPAAAAPALGDLETVLATQSYVGGFVPSKKDAEEFAKRKPADKMGENTRRWFEHIASFSEEERKQWA